MEPEKALEYIYDIASRAPVQRSVHAQVDQAYDVLKKALKPKEKPKK